MFNLIRSVVRDAVDTVSRAFPEKRVVDQRRWGEDVSPLVVPEEISDPEPHSGLPAHLRKPRLKPRPEDFSYVATLGRKFDAPDEAVRRLQKACAKVSHKFGVFVSMENEIPGLRRLVIYGPGYSKSRGYSVVGVTEDGLLFDGSVAAPDLASVGEILERSRNAYPVPVPDYNFSLNKRSKAFREDVSKRADQILDEYDPRDCDGFSDEKKLKNFRLSFISVTMKRSQEDLSLAAWAIMSALSPEISRVMRSTHMTMLDDAAWLSGKSPVVDDDSRDGAEMFNGKISEMNDREISRARVQAVKSYPIMAHAIKEHLSRWVDMRVPLAAEIASFFGVRESAVRRLNGLTWQRAGVAPFQGVRYAAMIVASPDHLAPENRRQHRIFRKIDGFRRIYGDAVFSTFSAGGSLWRHEKSLEKTTPQDAVDAGKYLVDKLFVPAKMRHIRASHQETGAVYEPYEKQYQQAVLDAVAFVRSLPASAMFEMSERWHRNLMRHENRIVTIDDGSDWEPLTEGVMEISPDVFVRERTSGLSLKDLGEDQNHCVGGYVSKVMEANDRQMTLIFSIEKGDEIIGTAEVFGERNRDGSWSFRSVQVRARGNDDPSAECRAAVRSVCKHLENLPESRMSAYLGSIERAVLEKEAANVLPLSVRNAGYNFWDDAQFSVAWEELSTYLPRKVRKAGLDAFVRSFGLPTPQPAPAEQVPFWDHAQKAVEKLLSGDHDEFREAVASRAERRRARDEAEIDYGEEVEAPF